MKKLSVVIIAFNEEKNIGRCIASVKSVADEVVVVDSFSTDSTRNIVEALGARFITHPFTGYGEQKNFALSEATHDHVLSLDADEAVDGRLLISIDKIKDQNFPAGGYTMNRCTNYCGKWIRHGLWYPDKKLRLFNRKLVQWTNDAIHETTLVKPNTTIGHLQGDILHYSYNSLEEHITQNNKFSTLSAENYYARGKKAGVFKIMFNPCWSFLSSYLFRMGFLDGFAGFVIAWNIAHLTFMKYYKLYALQQGLPVRPGHVTPNKGR